MLFPSLRRPALMRNGQRSIFNEFERLQRDMDQLFASSVAVSPAGSPALQFFRGDTGYLVRAHVPGLAPEALAITVHGKTLTIASEQSEEAEQDAHEYLLRERRNVTYSRSLTLPQQVDIDNVHATFTDGVVEIHLPLAPSEQPRRIEIGLS